MFENEIRDPGLQGVRFTFVNLTPDASCARIWYSSRAGGREVERALDSVAPFLRDRLAESRGLKRTPEIRCRRDDATLALGNETARTE